jgi:segregation and condensation protein B
LELKTIVEGLLFVSDQPLSLEKLYEFIEDRDIDPSRVKEVINQLNDEYRESQRAFTIKEVAEGYQFRTIFEIAPYAIRLKRDSPVRLSRAAVETLAVIAYRQPILRAEIEKIRGVDAGATLRNLLDKDLVRITDRRDSLPGRPMLYSTTNKFLEIFELKDLNGLPKIDEVKALMGPPEPRLF